MAEITTAKAAETAVRQRAKLRQVLTDYWCNAMGSEDVALGVVTRLVTLSDEFGVYVVLAWIDATTLKTRVESQAIRYLNGIARNVRAEGTHGEG